MNTKHAKSPCCQGKIIKFGKRRRQCIMCQKTWRIRKKKRGRKNKRSSPEFLIRYLDRKIASQFSLVSKKQGCNEDQLNRRMKRSLMTFIKNTSWPPIPINKPLIAIADGMMITIDRQMFTFYFILIRPVDTNQAIIVPPFIKKDSESCIGWHEAFKCLPIPVLRSIKALVSDGHTGLMSVAIRKNWIIQRCNFHAIALIQGRRSMRKRSRHRELGKFLYKLANDILTNPDENDIQSSLDKLEEIAQQVSSPKTKTILKGFIKNHRYYRSYLKYPKLNLPRTSNSAEVTVRIIRQLCRRAHGFRTIDSLALWAEALLKHKRTITCNSSLPTKLSR